MSNIEKLNIGFYPVDSSVLKQSLGKMDTFFRDAISQYVNKAFSVPILSSGTARLPEASENLLLLKQVVRKPLEAVLRYLGK